MVQEQQLVAILCSLVCNKASCHYYFCKNMEKLGLAWSSLLQIPTLVEGASHCLAKAGTSQEPQ